MIPSVPDFGFGPIPEPGRVDEVARGILRLTAPNPGLMTGPSTNTYVVGLAGSAVVDPGPADESLTAAIVAAAAPLGPMHTIVVTHTHVDHAPGAAALAAATGARVVGYGPVERVGEGWALARPGPGAGLLTLRAIHTPGHASDHLCWLVEEHALVFTGDHVMHGSTVVIRPPDGDLHQYLASLGPPPRGGGAHPHPRPGPRPADGPRARCGRRAGRPPPRPAPACRGRTHPARWGNVDELLGEVYGDVTERQLPVARFSLWAHLRALGHEGRATALDVAAGEDSIESRWAA